MKFFLSCLLLFTFSMTALADSFRTRVHSVIQSPQSNLPHLIRMENGRVAFVKRNAPDALYALTASEKSSLLLEVVVDKKNYLISASTLDHDEEFFSNEKSLKRISEPYEPTVLPNYSSATTIFNLMRRDSQRESQCYNRAHVWAYEEFNRSALKSQKLFLFFTQRYIWNYNYKWWFHVAPVVLVNQANAMVPRVIDRLFTRAPRLVKTWTDIFMKNRSACPVVNKYSDYEDHQQEQDCYLIPVSMYFWQPRDIETFETTGYQKTEYIDWEIDHAYWEAF